MFHLWGMIIIEPQDKELTVKEKEFCLEHERQHRSLWYRINSRALEREVQKNAIKELMKRGYSFEELLRMEIDYRLWFKYKLRLKDYMEFMKN